MSKLENLAKTAVFDFRFRLQISTLKKLDTLFPTLDQKN